MSSYANPTVPIPPNPVFVDAVVGKLQLLFGSMPWLTHSFGRSYIKKTNREGVEQTEKVLNFRSRGFINRTVNIIRLNLTIIYRP